MITAVPHYLIVAIAICISAFAGMAAAGTVSFVGNDNIGEGSRFDPTSKTVIRTEADNDLDICRTFLDGKTEILIPNASEDFSHAHLIVRGFDVDENAQPQQGFPFSEQDDVIFNNWTLGYLSGEYQAWSSSVFPVPVEYLHPENLLEVNIDVKGQQQTPPNALWCVAVDWGQLVFDGGLQNSATLERVELINTLKAGDDVSLQIEIDVKTQIAGDYLLELIFVSTDGHVKSTLSSGSQLFSRSESQTSNIEFTQVYNTTQLASGYYSLQAILYEASVTQNNVWPELVQDSAIHFFEHIQGQQPQAKTYLDRDSDTLLDDWEQEGDQDGDSIANIYDADDDGDGLSTRYEHRTHNYLLTANHIPNTDGDALPDYLDTDDDDDGKSTLQEGGWDDTDQDGVLNFLDAADNDPCFPDARHSRCDLDNDGIRNSQDLDVDGDGIDNHADTDSYPPVLADLVIPVIENTTFVVNLSLTDKDADGDLITYALTESGDATLFTIDTTTGEVQFKSQPDFDDGINEYNFVVTALANAKQAQANIKVNLLNIDDEILQPLSDINASANRIQENAPAGSEVGITAHAVDGDGDAVTYSLLNTFDDLFAINGQTGVISIVQQGVIDYEQKAHYTLDVKAVSTPKSGEQTTQFQLDIIQHIPDSDNDGVPDNVDPDLSDPCNPNPSTQGCRDQNNGGSDKDPKEAESALGTGNDGVGSLSILLLSILAVFLGGKIPRQFVVPCCLLMCSVMWTSKNVMSASLFDEMDLYVGAGAGNSQLNPDTSGTDYKVDSDSSASWKLTAGWNWTDNFAVEGYYTYLGEASFEQNGSLKYYGTGGSAIFQTWLKGSPEYVNSLSVFVKAGANKLSNESNDVRYEKNSVLQPLLAFGGEYVMPWQFSLRSELEVYGTDATVFSISAIKRFGFRSVNKSKPTPSWQEWGESQQADHGKPKNAPELPTFDALISEQDAIAMIKALPPTAAIRERSVAVLPIVVDLDRDGVLDDEDTCENSPLALKADNNGCTEVEGVIENVTFIEQSNELTANSTKSLEKIAQSLKKLPNIIVEIQGYVKDQGNKKDNIVLSQKRAQTVARALIKAGVSEQQLITRGYGALTPIASNLTENGETQNQRIELKVYQNIP